MRIGLRSGFVRLFGTLLVTTAVLMLVFRYLEGSGEFDLREIGVYGCRAVDSATVAPALHAYLGRPLPGLSARGIESELASIPGIDSAEVLFDLPDRLDVVISLSRPVLVLCDGAAEVALTGRCEPLPPTFLSDTLPRVEISGGDYHRVLPGLAEWASTGGIPDTVDRILVEPSGAVAIATDGMRIILGYSDFDSRMQTFVSSGGRCAMRNGWVEADTRFDGQLVLRGNPSNRAGVSI